MSGAATGDLEAQPSYPLGSNEIRAQLRQGAVAAVHQVNAQLVAVLCARAAAGVPGFPFGGVLRARLASLHAAHRERLACCGTLLVDLGFADATRWCNVGAAVEESRMDMRAVAEHWLPPEDAVLLAHSTLHVASAVLHAARSEAGVLLGASPETSTVIAAMTVKQLSTVAQGCPHWVLPRWSEAPRVWAELLDFAAGASLARLGVLRCWQLSGGRAGWLQPYFEARTEPPQT
jgi:hypothetical protein